VPEYLLVFLRRDAVLLDDFRSDGRGLSRASGHSGNYYFLMAELDLTSPGGAAGLPFLPTASHLLITQHRPDIDVRPAQAAENRGSWASFGGYLIELGLGIVGTA